MFAEEEAQRKVRAAKINKTLTRLIRITLIENSCRQNDERAFRRMCFQVTEGASVTRLDLFGTYVKNAADN